MKQDLERRIAERFREIADCGWFPETVAADDIQLRVAMEEVAPGAGMRILDAGCARGRFLHHLRLAGASAYGFDITETFLQSVNGEVACASLTAIPFASGAFDAVICIEALEHVPDTKTALREMARVLRPGGKLLIIDKSWWGVNPRNGIPNIIMKPWRELRGRWMYPQGFGFREKWFSPGKLARSLRGDFTDVQVRFLRSGISKIVPALAFEAAWTGIKRPKEPA